jgi:hypothetical protein
MSSHELQVTIGASAWSALNGRALGRTSCHIDTASFFIGDPTSAEPPPEKTDHNFYRSTLMTDSKKPQAPVKLSSADLRLSRLCGLPMVDRYDRGQETFSVPANTYKLCLPNSREEVDVREWSFPDTRTVQSDDGDSFRLTRQSQWVVIVPDVEGFTLPLGSKLQLITTSSVYKMTTSPAYVPVAGRPVQDVLADIEKASRK